MTKVIHPRLDSEQNSAITLNAGKQVVNAKKNSRLQGLTVSGRTLINLLGEQGSGESLNGFQVTGNRPTISTTQKKSGDSSLKFVANNEAATLFRDYNHKLDKTKHYIVGFWAFIESYTSGTFGIQIRDYGASITRYSAFADNTIIGKWQFVYIKIPLDNTITSTYKDGGFRITIGCASTSNPVLVGYMDDIRIYSVSPDEFDKVNDNDDVIPYVAKGTNGVNGLYVKKWGKNLLPSNFTVLHSNAKLNGSYDMTLNAVTTYQTSYMDFQVVPGAKYTFKIEIDKNGGYVDGGFFNSDYGRVGQAFLPGQKTPFTVPQGLGITFMRVYFSNTIIGVFNFKNWMLVLGDESNMPKTFYPREDSIMSFSGVELHSNPADGSDPDVMREVGGRYEVVRKYRKLVLDGSLDWKFHAQTFIASKQVKVALPNAISTHQNLSQREYVIDESGYLLYHFDINDSGFPPEASAISSDEYLHLILTINSTGWGESYTPTNDEIKAYFYGWRMVRAGSGSAYDGTGTKGWINRDGSGTVVTTLPKGENNKRTGQYTILYRLKNPIIETVQQEGDLIFHEGDNLVEVGSGFVNRERIIPIKSGDVYHINNKYTPAISVSKFKYQTESIENVYANNLPATGVVYKYEENAYGKQNAHIPALDYDPTVGYSASYITRDKYPIPTVYGIYASTQMSQIFDISDGLEEALSKISVIESKTSNIHAPNWIEPTLVNGWRNLEPDFYEPAGYYKDDTGKVRLKGVIAGGLTDYYLVFKLPVGYRPKKDRGFAVIGDNNHARVDILDNGTVIIRIRGSEFTSLSGIVFDTH